ncbi:MAG: RBBP9/YdeN family alpha/beta hydrolase [Novosphingobium sp.]
MAILEPHTRAPEPLVLTVPGLSGSGSTHWQSVWERERRDCRRVELGMWDNPHRNTWINQLNLAIERADRPVVLAAHSLGCLAVAWWTRYEQPRSADPVIGALLVAPPDAEQGTVDPRIAKFAPLPDQPLPFPTILVASRNDPYMDYPQAVKLARNWGSWLVDAGRSGHINADSGLGDWPFGQVLLGRLLTGALLTEEPDRPAAALAMLPGGAVAPL